MRKFLAAFITCQGLDKKAAKVRNRDKSCLNILQGWNVPKLQKVAARASQQNHTNPIILCLHSPSLSHPPWQRRQPSKSSIGPSELRSRHTNLAMFLLPNVYSVKKLRPWIICDMDVTAMAPRSVSLHGSPLHKVLVQAHWRLHPRNCHWHPLNSATTSHIPVFFFRKTLGMLISLCRIIMKSYILASKPTYCCCQENMLTPWISRRSYFIWPPQAACLRERSPPWRLVPLQHPIHTMHSYIYASHLTCILSATTLYNLLFANCLSSFCWLISSFIPVL